MKNLSRIEAINQQLNDPMLTSVERMSLCLEKFNLLLSKGRNMLNQDSKVAAAKPDTSANLVLPIMKGLQFSR